MLDRCTLRLYPRPAQEPIRLLWIACQRLIAHAKFPRRWVISQRSATGGTARETVRSTQSTAGSVPKMPCFQPRTWQIWRNEASATAGLNRPLAGMLIARR